MKNSKNYETLKTLKQIDKNIWMLEYKDFYGLEKILEAGEKSLLKIVKILKKEISKKINVNQLGGGFACSTYQAKTPEGKHLLGRNFDYKEGPCIVLWTKPKDGYKSISIVDCNFLLYGYKLNKLENAKSPMRLLATPYACMDGINEKGLAGAILEIKSKPTAQKTGKKPIITNVAFRAILDKCKDVDEAIKFLSKYDMNDVLGVSYHYQFSDSTGNTAVIEYVDNKMYVIQNKEQNVSTNFFLTPGGDNKKEMGRNRYKTICKKLKEENNILSEEQAMKLLANATVYYHHKRLPHMVTTLWSSVYNNENKTLSLCAGMDYSKMYKFDINKPGEYEMIEQEIRANPVAEDNTNDNLDVILSAKNIFKSYGEGQGIVHALNGISLDIYRGELLVILGSSGSGKSTLLNMLGGTDVPDSGEIIFEGKNICKYKDKKLTDYRKKNIGFVFQSFNLINEITAKENIALTADEKRDSEIVDKSLMAVNLYDKQDKYPSQLSGGEQQRVSIARALAKQTSILLCDEPTGALDYETGKQILCELEKLARENGKTVVIVTHTREIGKMADRIISMKNGEIIEVYKNDNPIVAKNIEW